LPVGVGGTPSSYVSPKTGKQYVVVSAGGARMTRAKGDYVIAYALP
jgi:quinate dehydrogenase (quinone)